ncbi:AMP-binding protein [Streptomyces decoyicus]|uniref:AMP-binding protein n=1 Tax=Streptomyces decoyicus TaxID=249567 RepID=UPI00386EDA77
MLPALVRTHAKTHPHRMAVVVGHERLTYGELDGRVSRLIHQLRSRGIGCGSLVGVHLDRTPDAVVALLAVLGTGAAYTVVEPTDPVGEGVGRLVAAGPELVVSSSRYEPDLRWHGLAVQDVHEIGTGGSPEAGLATSGEDDTAYILYTSGSTGRPKGVMVSHGNIRHYTESLLGRLAIDEPLNYAHVTTLAADLGNTCLFLALWTGGTLHLVDDATRRDPQGMLRYLHTEQVDVLKTTPSHWSVVFRAFNHDRQTRPELRFLLLGGELMSLELARRILTSGVTGTLVNHYGPTEATVGIAAHVLTGEADLDRLEHAASVPIGTPLGATRLLVRTDDGRYEERDAVGELYVQGPSVTLGYRGNEAASAAAFIEIPGPTGRGDGPGADASAGVRSYRTGDKVRADAHGVLEFLGRGDRQVKVGGYRVELGHIESGLRRLPEVADAFVVHRAGRQPALVAAVVPHGLAADSEPSRLRTDLRSLLPYYMVPDRVAVFEAFPRTPNGKTDHAALRGRIEECLTVRTQHPHAAGDEVLAEVCAVWQRHLGHGDFGIHDDFNQVGGSSIGAIQVIADLQAKGHQVSAAAFLAEPTAAALAARLKQGWGTESRADPHRPARRVDDAALAPAQEWFFRQDFAQPDQWNQALLLDVDEAVRPEELAAAVDDVMAVHPMLHTAFRRVPAGHRRDVVAPGRPFSTSVLPDGSDLIVQHIQQTAAGLQSEIKVADGDLFKAHLFRGTTSAHLLLICHHLSIDAVSWGIVVNDLSRCYSERLRGNEPRTAAGTTGFGAWATHLSEHAAALRADLAHWEGLDRIGLPQPGATGRGGTQGDNREGDAQTLWFRLSRAETDALARTAIASTDVPPHASLLGAFAHALAELRGSEDVVVDVESHGRATFDDELEVSRAVGWFTSTFPAHIGIVAGDIAATGKAAASALSAVPHLGIAYGLHGQPQRSDVCFNYLGSLPLPYGDDLRPSLSRYPVGPVRGAENDRGYGLKLTARIHDGQLVADLSYTPRRHDPEQMLRLARATRAHLRHAAGGPPDEGQFVLEHGSSTGLLAQVPRELRCEPPAGDLREYGTVVLTGATGFIGAHLLRLLLTRTKGRIHCLVRAREGRSAAERLDEVYAWYHPGEDLGRYSDRLTVFDADLSEPGFALADDEYRRLCREAEAIYHLASDTRLFGDRESFDRHNTGPVREMIRLADTDRPKDLHYVSTLAVCGSGAPGEAAVFSEDSLNIGQTFLNEYERSKYEAELLVREFAAAGGAGYIYRSGNVTGHSMSGRFQRNGGDNRLVQMLRAAVRLGRVPRVGAQTLALSPVDVVAEGILEISRSERVRGGIFHVDTHHQVSYQEIFTALRELGCAVADDGAPDFAALFGHHLGDEGSNEQIALAHFWANRPGRNVRYDHSRTGRLLAELGVMFPQLDGEWLRTYFSGLIQQGEITVTDEKLSPMTHKGSA